jgi:PAS domain S-box-containing protein
VPTSGLGPQSASARPEDSSARFAAIAAASDAFGDAVPDIEALLAVIAEHIARATGDFCSLVLLSSDSTRIEPVAAFHPDPMVLKDASAMLGVAIELEAAGPWLTVIRERRTIVIEIDPDHLPANVAPHQARHIQKWRMRQAVMIPMIAQGRVVGGLNLNRMEGATPLRQPDLELLEGLAARAARAIATAQLVRDQRLLASELEAKVNERTRELSAANQSLQTMLNYQAVFESSPDPMWVEDAETLAILAVNDPAIERYGYTREEFLVRTAKDLRPPEEVPAFLDLLAKTEADQRQSRSAIHRTKDGSSFEAEVTFTPSFFGDRRVHIVIVQDVTEKRRRDEQLAQSQRLESLGQLAGGVAHDFNNLLAVILNVTDQMRLQLVAPDHDDQDWLGMARDLERVDKAANSATRLTRQLLAFARKQIVQPTVLDLSRQIEDLIELLRRTLGSHVVLTTNLAANLWPVLMDSGQLEQIVINLAVNSRDAMPRGGALSISTANVTVEETDISAGPDPAPPRFVQLRVSDSGTGMDKATMDHVFEPFFTTKPVGQGTGLGLATVYGIVKQVEGHISIDSELGRGTTVSVLIPATDRPLPAAPAPVPINREPVTGTVLVVEDYGELRDLFEVILKGAGYRVMTAPDGSAALELARSHRGRIDVLLTDVVMPNMLGPELAQQLRAENPRLRVVFMSGHAQPMLGTAALEPGVPLLQKPFMAPELLQKLREVLAAPIGGGGDMPID